MHAAPPKKLIWWKRDEQVLTSSMRWWAMSVVQGILYSLGPVLLGLTLAVLYSITGETNMLLVAVALLVVGFGYIAWYAAAPITRKWEIIITDDRYYVVEDAQGTVFGYLGPGFYRVPWHKDAYVRGYVDFKTVPVYEYFEGLRWADETEGYIEIKLMMAFNPVQADPTMYGTLRRMTQREAFKHLIRNDLLDFLRYQATLLAWDEFIFLVGNSKTIEGAIMDGLEPLAAIGLTPAEDESILVLVDSVSPVVERSL